MSPRPRKASDEEVFAATHRVMQQAGPAQLTLGRIAAEAGVTAGALVQRFGSRRGLMLALMAQFSGSAPVMFAQIRAAHPSPLAALRAYAECHAQMGESPQTLAHHLSYLQIDLTDPDFHQHVQPPALALHALEPRLHLLLFRVVHADGDRHAARGGHQLRRLLHRLRAPRVPPA